MIPAMKLFDDELEFREALGRPVLSWDASLRPGAPPAASPAVATAGEDQPDLFYLESVFVTAGFSLDEGRKLPVGWNNNDDFFDPADVWVARSSPEDKPLNVNHNCGDIIGHITEVYPEDLAGAAIANDALVVPENYNLVTKGVLYRVWWTGKEHDEKKEAMVAGIIGEILEDKWRVSMECLFSQFDYALADASGNVEIVKRARETSHLTKYLRVAGGKGVYGGKRIGRVPRKMTFSGKGLVKNPANAKSVIRADEFAPTSTPTSISASISVPAPVKNTEKQDAVYESLTKDHPEHTKMTENEQKLQAELAQAKKALEEASQKEIAELKTALAAEQTAKKALEEAVKAANEQAKASVEGVVAEKKELATALEKANAELAAVQVKQVKLERVAQAVDRLKLEKANAEKLVENIVGLSAEQFEAHLDLLAQSMNMAPTNNPQAGNTGAGAGVNVKLPEKKTPLPAPPKKTPLPAPKPAVAATADDETDSADPADLETVEPEPDAALATANEVKTKAEQVRGVFTQIFARKK